MKKFKYFEDLFWKNVHSSKNLHGIEFKECIKIKDLETAFENAVFETKVESKKQEADDTYFKVDKNGITIKGNISSENRDYVAAAFEKVFK